jgi:cell division protein FtsI/penicillin-binding protein 2
MKPNRLTGAIDSTYRTSKRASVILIVILVFIFGLIIQLFTKSVLRNGLAEARSRAQQAVSITVNPDRGEILVNGQPGEDDVEIALNEPKVMVEVIPRNILDVRKVADSLSPLIGVEKEELFNKINNDKAYIPPVARKLSIEVGEKIKSLNFSGVSVSNEYIRSYPEGSLAASLLGFVNAEGNGQYGVEGYYNNQLQGFASDQKATRDGFGNVYLNDSSGGQNKGANIVLTIDRDVQATVEQMLAESMNKFTAKSASVIIVNPKTGAIIAMANAPTFDPNKYNEVKSGEQNIFQNPCISRSFEPGSVMKTITIASAIDSGKMAADYENTYAASVNVDGYDIHTAEDKAFGRESVTDVLVNSDNVGMVDIGNKLGRELFNDYLSRFGFSDKTGIDLEGESTGQLPSIQNWRAVNTATIAFGQGVTVTPLQMVMAYAAIANNGSYMQPYSVANIELPNGQIEEFQPVQVRNVISEKVAKEVTEMLVQVVVRGHGKKAGVAGYNIAGKTGTAQIADPEGKGYLENKNNGSFAGYAPAEDPKFAMFVTLEEPQGVEFAESSAAPLWGQIASYLLKNYFHIAPNK